MSQGHSTSINFSYNSLIHKFDTTSFNPAYTYGKVSQEDVDRVFQKVNSLPNVSLQPSWIPTIIVITISLFFTGLFGIGLYFFINNATRFADGNGFIIFPIFGVGLTVGILLVIFSLTYISNRYRLSRIRNRITEIQNCLKEINDSEFRAKGVSWKSGLAGYNITLELDFLIQQMNENAFAMQQNGYGQAALGMPNYQQQQIGHIEPQEFNY